MKVLVIGSTGTIGRAVSEALSADHEVIGASRSSTTRVDLDDVSTVRAALAELGPLDAIVVTAGNAAMGPLDELDDGGFELGLRSKLMGQVNVVREAAHALKPGGSITLTAGQLAHSPWPGTSAIAMMNGAIESFVRAAALDRPDQRINAVSPPLVHESAQAMGVGGEWPTAAEVATLYQRSVEGSASGHVYAMGE